MNTSSILWVVVGIWALVSAVTSLECYECLGCEKATFGKTVQCTGSCAIGRTKGLKLLDLGCIPRLMGDICYGTEEGLSGYVCYCNTDLCNNGPFTIETTMMTTTTMKPMSSGTRSSVPLIMVLTLCMMVYTCFHKHLFSF